VLALALLVWLLAAIISWFWILLSGQLPPTLWQFGHGVMRYSLRVEAYLLLLHDEFPPFTIIEPWERTAAAMSPVPA
jgi:hypothetical protein